MLERDKTTALKESAASASEFAASLAMDKKFRKELLSAIGHGTLAQKRAARKIGFYAAMLRLKQDPMLRREVNRMMSSLDKAWSRVEKKRSHKLRNTVLVLGTAGGVAAIVAKTNLHKKLPGVGNGTAARAIDAWTEVRVPVSVAYNQWTQFEDFPLFMEGVDHVQQLDDTRLHWVANVAGKQARMGREDHRAASRPADQLDQRGRQEDAGHGQLRAARRRQDARPPVDELLGGGPGRAASARQRGSTSAASTATSNASGS